MSPHENGADAPPRRASFTLGPVGSDKHADTPAPSRYHEKSISEDSEGSDGSSLHGSGSPGYLPDDVYEQTMGWWRAAIRRRLVRSVEWESKVIASMQAKIRTRFLDSYFVYTSSLGTHTFFMIALPACFFFGLHQLGRGIVFVVAMSGYVTSFLKDLICSPRPFAPPVTRLTIGSHHLEYGFPSTHSANGVAMALFGLMSITRLLASGAIADGAYTVGCVFLAWYTFSIVFGRLYTGMHSFTDVTAGSAAGALVWATYWACEDALEAWLASPGWDVPAIVATVCLIMVHKHPQPVDDCPCFEDAIAFISVIMGCFLGRWHSVKYGFDDEWYRTSMPGSAFAAPADAGLWLLFAALKMLLGTLVIFAWRLIAKPTLHILLPPTFRLLAQIFTLPHRRFYTPATDYKSVPAEKGLHPIPSVIDLPTQVEEVVDGDGLGRPSLRVPNGMKYRGGGGGKQGGAREKAGNGGELGLGLDSDVDVEYVKHYDADVLTKVFVYCGIALISVEALPMMFELTGMGVFSS
ncbi:hypothetical protein PUNSTDRAFT_87143 [Punctularia strigosozonata HHB-11173 SS5]|uniref:uncharacterized protein n=1 Tax=Punctularia strigosozonata (strain HHB-11173) TaxID=741275 RepID=UPI00044164B3|nr:uncharacterized protein PUNSTDRAFT_87143 [Punctularia strigosozonata HHB-11173 SS5]EIN09036.1 hypothetical protein PUNSTDRAFT_87143 [Punctularia strigosozonata HHB-11173 SS5]